MDYVICKQSTKLSVQDIKVHIGCEYEMYHHLLKTTVRYPASKIKRAESVSTCVEGSKTPKYNIQELKDDSERFLYKTRLISQGEDKNWTGGGKQLIS